MENETITTARRILIYVAYDGTSYHGFQVQPGVPTIEGILNETLSSLFKEDIAVIGASRTDSGVHSKGNIAVFDTNARIPAEKVPYALNRQLPEDIRIVGAAEVKPDFHPRHTDTRKTYEYRIICSPFESPINRLYAHWTYNELDAGLMQRGAEFLKGEHDFKSFCSVNTQAESTVRTIYDISVVTEKAEKDSKEIVISVTGNGFLYNMIRIIAGTLMEVGRGKYPPEKVKEMLDACDRSAAGPTAPAKGLMLAGYEICDRDIFI